MHEPYDDEDYEDDDYNNDYPMKPPYQWYYKFDIGPDSPISQWINEIVNDFVDPFKDNVWNPINIPGFSSKKFPVNSYISNTGKDNTFQYLGNNYDNVKIWKKKYFVSDPIQVEYINHIQNHSVYFIRQPHYYKGLFDILN